MASTDLKDAYYSVSIRETDRKFLRFEWEGQLWQFDCMPNGLAPVPRKFTKLLKPVFATLREKGHLDDFFLLAETEMSCAKNVRDTVKLLQSLGFIVHPEKSVFEPIRRIEYLGVVIDSQSMTVMLTAEKQADIIACCSKAEKKQSLTIRDIAKIIGKIVASLPAVMYFAAVSEISERQGQASPVHS